MEYNNFKKVLVTGANGFIGTNLIEFLCKNQVSDGKLIIRAMILKGTPTEDLKEFQERFNHDFKKKYNREKLEIIFADLLDPKSLEIACESIDIIIHLAGIVTDWGPKKLFQTIIVDGTENLLKAASKTGVSRIIYMSSLTVHDMNGHHYDDENAPRDMKFFAYGVAKKEAEDLIQNWAQKKDLSLKSKDYAIIRPGFIIYGPRDKNSFIQILDRILNRKLGFEYGGKSLISYVYCENLCYGIHLLVKADKINGPYIISDGNMTWKQWIQNWSDIAGTKPPSLNLPYELLFPIVGLMVIIYKIFRIKKSPPLNFYRIRVPRKDLAFVNDKIKKELGYKPPIPFNETLKNTMEYYREFKNFKENKYSK